MIGFLLNIFLLLIMATTYNLKCLVDVNKLELILIQLHSIFHQLKINNS